MELLRWETNRPFPSTGEYINFVQDNIQRLTGQPCTLNGGSTAQRAESLIRRLAAIGALEILEV